MRRRVRVVRSARRDLDRLRASVREIEQVVAHLGELASSTTSAFDVPFYAGQSLLYSDVGRIRIVLKFVGDDLVVLEFGLVA